MNDITNNSDIDEFQLRGQLQSGPSEIAKAAQSISELSELWQPEEELSGIEVIEQDQRLLVKHFKSFENDFFMIIFFKLARWY